MKRLILVTVIFCYTQIANAQLGELDRSFGTEGIIQTSFNNGEIIYNATAIQSDGKIVVAGNSNGDFMLARYNMDGSLDNSFSVDGMLLTDFGTPEDIAMSVALQSDGKIVVVGYTSTSNVTTFALARYDQDGSLDNTFSGDGKQTTDFSSSFAAAFSVVIQSDGKIIVAGASADSLFVSNFAIARYNINGSLDDSFAEDGKQITPNTFRANSVLLQKDGKIVAGGWGFGPTDLDFTIARYNTDGSLDSTLDEDGIQKADLGNYETASAMAIQADGKIVLAGRISDPDENTDFALVRFNVDGSLDNSFSGDGSQITDFDFNEEASSVVILNNGKIIAGGSILDFDGVHFALAAYNIDGSLDNTFSLDGKQITKIGQGGNITELAIADDKLYAIGTSNGYSENFGLVARYLIDNTAASLSIDITVNNSYATEPATIDIYANATAVPGKTIDKVEFFNGTELLYTDNSFPYNYTWTSVPAGEYFVSCKATDNDGLIATSASIWIQVVKNEPPALSLIIPVDNQSYISPATVEIYADAYDQNPGGTIEKVEFYNGSTLLYTDDTTPYTYAWRNVLAGNYTLSAKATDNSGLVTTSSNVNITVAQGKTNVALTIPYNIIKYTAPARIKLNAAVANVDGTITKVQFFSGTTRLHTEDVFPYGFLWDNVPAGNYTLTAKAFDNSGNVTTSNSIEVSVVAENVPPVVSIVSPANDTTYPGPASIRVIARAKDPNDRINKVEFYNGTALLRTEYYYPYTYWWYNIQPGTYTLTAVATDDKGLSATSEPVTVTVTAPSVPMLSSRLFSSSSKTNLNDALSLKLSPNPADKTLQIYTRGLQRSKQSTISVISPAGVELKTIQTNNAARVVQLDVSSLVSGIYTIKLVSGDMVIYKRFVKL